MDTDSAAGWTSGRIWPSIVVFSSTLLMAHSALALSFSLTQVGGSAQDGRGRIGDTPRVAVDVAIEADEAATGVFPSLWWDSEGGNVLDIVSATGGTGATVLVGFGRAIPGGLDEELLAELIRSGVSGPAVFRPGTVDLRLAAAGATTRAFLQAGGHLASLVVVQRGTLLANDEIGFGDIPASAIEFDALQIALVPEPSAAILLGLGLIGLGGASVRVSHPPSQARMRLTERGPEAP
jgi:hypothetical protein